MTTTPGWDGEQLDLDAYLHRIGFDGDPAPTLAALRALHRGHVTSIPFENLEIMLGRGVPLDLASVQDKLVRRRRGGYCFEHTRLFAAALERLGFGFTALTGRVSMGSENKFRPATHALLRVETADDERAWLCDVGFGAGPLEPLEFADGATATQGGGWRYRGRCSRRPPRGPRTGGSTGTTSPRRRRSPSTTRWATTSSPRTRVRRSAPGRTSSATPPTCTTPWTTSRSPRPARTARPTSAS